MKLCKTVEHVVEWGIDMSQKKNMEKTRSCYDKEPDKKTVWLQLLPLLFVVGIVPLICRMTEYTCLILNHPLLRYMTDK